MFTHILSLLHNLTIHVNLAAVLVDPGADQTGVSGAMIGLARIGAGFLAGVLTLFLVVQGYEYMATDQATRGTHLKKAIATLLGGAVLILVAATMAPQIVTAIVTGK
jgi:hypothetical protein